MFAKSPATRRRHVVRRRGLLCLALAALAPIFFAYAQMQRPVVPRPFFDDRRSLEGDRITFCLNPEALTYEFDRAVASALADMLLLEPAFYEIDPIAEAPPMDYRLGLSQEDVFVLLAEECDAFVGFKLAPFGYPEWMAFTRPYYVTDYVLVTRNPTYESLADVPLDERIGTRFTSQGDTEFVVFLQARSEEDRWGRAPYSDNTILLERLEEGEVDTALVWEPTFTAALGDELDDDEFRIISPAPFREPAVRFGLVLESRDSFLRASLDEAIVALVEDGVIETLLSEYGVPGRAPDLEAR